MSDVVVLLGAGASIDAGLPSSVGLTSLLLAHLDGLDDARASAAARFVYHTLAADGARRYSNGVDVERFVASIQVLANRDRLSVSPFIDSWHRGLAGFETNPSGAQSSAGRVVQQIAALDDRQEYGQFRQFEQVGAQLVNLINEVTGARRYAQTFTSLEHYILLSLFTLLALRDVAATDYLQPLVRSATRAGIPIATLNYDLSVETCATALGVGYSTGVERWRDDELLRFEPGGLHLLKLHGSLEWSMKRVGSADGLTSSVVDVLPRAEHEPPDAEPAVIFGEGNKLSAEGPFLEVFMEFSRRLTVASTLVVVGYSFRDNHINEVVSRWMNRDGDNRIIIVDPDLPQPRTDGITVRSWNPLQPLRNELVQLHDRGATRVVLVPKGAVDGIPNALHLALSQG